MTKRFAALLMTIILIMTAAAALAEDEWPWAIRNGSRDSNMIAITVDDCYERDKVRLIFDLCVSEGVCVTFFPLGEQLKEADRELWREIAESPYAEIGSHTQHHTRFDGMTHGGINIHLRRTQECLDAALGYHYELRWMRPPFGTYRDQDGSAKRIKAAVNDYGYDHVILWDVSQTKAKDAMEKVKNGSILLYHARNKDYKCLVELIPMLKEAGYEPVTISTLLGMEKTDADEAAQEETTAEQAS